MDADTVFEARFSRSADCPNSIKELCGEKRELLRVPSHLVGVCYDLVIFGEVTNIVGVGTL